MNLLNNEMGSYSGFFIRMTSSAPASVFSYLGGYMSNNSAKIQLAGGVSLWKDIKVGNFSANIPFTLGGTVTMDGVTFR